MDCWACYPVLHGPPIPIELDTEPPVAGAGQVHSVADVCSLSFDVERATFKEPVEASVKKALKIYMRATASQRMHILNFWWHKRPGLSASVRKLLSRTEYLRRKRDLERFRRAGHRGCLADVGSDDDLCLVDIGLDDLGPLPIEDDHGVDDLDCAAIDEDMNKNDDSRITVSRASLGNKHSEPELDSEDLTDDEGHVVVTVPDPRCAACKVGSRPSTSPSSSTESPSASGSSSSSLQSWRDFLQCSI